MITLRGRDKRRAEIILLVWILIWATGELWVYFHRPAKPVEQPTIQRAVRSIPIWR